MGWNGLLEEITMADSSERKRPLSTQGTWRTYTPLDGLPSILLTCVTGGQDGFLWFGTWDSGLCRFDGEVFQTFDAQDTLGDCRIGALHQDQQNRLWIGTAFKGLWVYDGETFRSVGTDRVPFYVSWLSEDRDGRLWYGGERSLGYYDGVQVRDLAPDYVSVLGSEGEAQFRDFECWGIGQDIHGRLWFGAADLICYDGGDFHRYRAVEGGIVPIEADQPYRVHYAVGQDAEGQVWIAGGDQVWRHDGRAFKAMSFPTGHGVRAIQCDADGRMWFHTIGGGTLWYDGETFHAFTTRDGLASDNIQEVCRDREGHLWFATWGGGASCYDPISLERLFPVGGKPGGEPQALCPEGYQRVWVGLGQPAGADQTLEGPSLARWEKAGCEFLNVDLGDCCAICVDPHGGLWFGGTSGLLHYDGRRFSPLKSDVGWTGKAVTALAVDAQGHLYIAHEDAQGRELQLTCYDGRCFRVLWHREKRYIYHLISALYVTQQDTLWFGIGGHGGFEVAEGLGHWHGNVTFYTQADGLVDDRITALMEDGEGHLWIATLGGISRFDGHSFQNYTPAEGLPNPRVHDLCADPQDRLWLATDAGLVCYDGQAFQTVWLPQLGFPLRLCWDGTDGLWIGTRHSVVRYRPQAVPPKVRLLPNPVDAANLTVTEDAVTTETQPVIFEYRGMSFRTHPRDMLYTYRLMEHQTEWQPPTHQQRAVYRALPPGDYTFQVRALDRDLNVSETVTADLQVVPDPHLAALHDALSAASPAGEFVGESAALRRVQQQLAEVASTDLTVLILGETGTGKGLAARAVHALSPRQTGPFITVSCGALPDRLVECEIFGHEKGAFTGAHSRKLGKVEVAQGGTFFLDEIGDLPLEAQVKFLRLLEEKTFERVGGTRELRAEVRVVAATNRNLEEMVREGAFRADLFYRLQEFEVELPPLRQRSADIPLLAHYFMGKMAAHLNKKVTALSREALSRLQAYPWPGNVRELEHVIKRAVVVCDGTTLQGDDLALETAPRAIAPPKLTPEEYEREYLKEALEESGWVVKGPRGAAARLGLPETTLRNRLKKLGLRRPQARNPAPGAESGA